MLYRHQCSPHASHQSHPQFAALANFTLGEFEGCWITFVNSIPPFFSPSLPPTLIVHHISPLQPSASHLSYALAALGVFFFFLSRSCFTPVEAQRVEIQAAQVRSKMQDSLLHTSPSAHATTPLFHNGWHCRHLPQPGLRATWPRWPHLRAVLVKPRDACVYIYIRQQSEKGGPEANWTRWTWSSPTLCSQLQGFSCGPAVRWLHRWSATSTPEVRPRDWLNEGIKWLCSFWGSPSKCLTSMCSSSTVYVWGEAVLPRWNLDGQRLHAVHLSATCGCRLLWDVSNTNERCGLASGVGKLYWGRNGLKILYCKSCIQTFIY